VIRPSGGKGYARGRRRGQRASGTVASGWDRLTDGSDNIVVVSHAA
jgi:hypothetical protein